MPEMQIEEPADEIAHLLVRVYEIPEIIIAETGDLPGLREAPQSIADIADWFKELLGDSN